QPEFVTYQRAVIDNAKLLASELQHGGLRIVSGGTDTHLLLVDLSATGITGKQAEDLLDSVYITVNKNAIPFDTRPPHVAGGIRLGTAAVTTRGFGPAEIRRTAMLILKTLSNLDDEKVHNEVREEVAELTSRFPVPGLD
ncbi:MAG: serine hydroxymethyltransferase, partial [Chloroflexota bacterium]